MVTSWSRQNVSIFARNFLRDFSPRTKFYNFNNRIKWRRFRWWSSFSSRNIFVVILAIGIWYHHAIVSRDNQVKCHFWYLNFVQMRHPDVKYILNALFSSFFWSNVTRTSVYGVAIIARHVYVNDRTVYRATNNFKSNFYELTYPWSLYRS